MFSAADTALDLLVLELILDTALFALLLGLRCLRLPVHAGSENDVLTDGGRVERRSGGVALLQPKLGPAAALGHLRVDVFANDGRFDAAGHFHLLAVIVEPVRDHRLGAILVGRHLLCGERGGVIELLVVGPVGAAKNEKFRSGEYSCCGISAAFTHFPSLDIVRFVLF